MSDNLNFDLNNSDIVPEKTDSNRSAYLTDSELTAIVFDNTDSQKERPFWKIWEVVLCFATVYVISSCCSILCFASGLSETISGIIATFVQEALSVILPFMLVYNIYGFDKTALGFSTNKNLFLLLKSFLLGIAYYFLATIILLLIKQIYPYDIQTQATLLPIMNAESMPVLLTLLFITGILAPAAEEIFFRSFLYSAMRHRFSVAPAAIISGLLFGAVHFDLFRLLPISVLGILLCLFYEKYRNIYMNIAVHIGFNCTSLFLLLLIE